METSIFQNTVKFRSGLLPVECEVILSWQVEIWKKLCILVGQGSILKTIGQQATINFPTSVCAGN